MRFLKTVPVLFSILFASLALLVATAPARAEGEVVDAAPDLIVEIELDPETPTNGQSIDLYVTVTNIGDASTGGGFQLDVYYNRSAVPAANEVGDSPTTLPALAPGQSTTYSVLGAATANSSCGWGVYARVDRANAIAESNETNNFASLCAAPPGTPDAYEPDNTCAAAKWFTQGASQDHNLLEPSPGTPDEDWIKFTAYAIITYTVATSTTTSSADPRIAILGSCGGSPVAGPSNNSATFVAPYSGVFYAQVKRAGTSAITNSNYDLSLDVNSGINDAYEPDDSCANARDITTDGVKQNHRFNKPSDEDWVKFSVPAGAAFTVVADGGTGGANPVITIASSCANATSNQPPAEVNVAEATASESAEAMATINGNAATTTIYYVKARNQNGTVWGENVRYDLRVTVSACTTDSFEPDNSAAQARTLTLGALQSGRVHCPPGDQDWVQFSLTTGKTYVLETRDLAAAADTVLSLFAPDKVTLIGENDDYGYTKGSRLVFTANATGTHYARIRHSNPSASGAGTAYSIALLEGVCVPLGGDAAGGDNGAGDASALTPNGAPLSQNFCADPLNDALGDQDWMSFSATAGTKYQIKTTGLGSNSDTVVELYNSTGQLLLRSDDVGAGRATTLNYTPTSDGALFVRVLQFNSNYLGDQSTYQVALTSTQPPTPTPTPSPTPIPPPTPTPANPASAKTLIVVNRARVEALYGSAKTSALMTKLFQLADRAEVQGAVIQVENVPAIAAAYAAWTADANSLLDNDKANAVAEAIRAQLMSFIQGSDDAQYVVLVGDDRIIPFRRTLDLVVPPGNSTSTEDRYATEVSDNSTVRAALAEKMILTDDYYVDKQPGTWKDKQRNVHELFLPDLAVSRLVEDPNEIVAYINQYISNRTIQARRVLVTGYDFVQDGAASIKTLYGTDISTVPGADIKDLIAPTFTGGNFRSLHLTSSPPFEIASINGHSTHKAILMPPQQGEVPAAEVDAATGLAGTLVYSMGCHGGLNDPGLLDLPQAYMRRKATYVGNTGFGWGGGGTVYTEAMMRNFTRELLRDATAEVGPSLTAAKLKYYSRVQVFNAFDAKILMQMTLYGLPMFQVKSGGTLSGEDDFPSAEPTNTPPTSFGDALATGQFGYGLDNSFGSFGGGSTSQGTQFNLDGNVVFEAGAPVQPTYFGGASAPAAGTLRGVLFLGGTFKDEPGVDPVIALAVNEYVTDRSEPDYVAPGGWSPALPFTARNSDDISPPPGVQVDAVALSLGQYDAAAPAGTVLAAGGSGTQRLYDAMSLSTLYSFSADQAPPTITVIDGVLNAAGDKGNVKVEANDPSGVVKVVIAYTVGANEWKSKEATFNAASQKWLAEIPATVGTTWFVQVADGAGNVAVDNNKGNNYPMLPQLPLATGAGGGVTVFLPIVDR